MYTLPITDLLESSLNSSNTECKFVGHWPVLRQWPWIILPLYGTLRWNETSIRIDALPVGDDIKRVGKYPKQTCFMIKSDSSHVILERRLVRFFIRVQYPLADLGMLGNSVPVGDADYLEGRRLSRPHPTGHLSIFQCITSYCIHTWPTFLLFIPVIEHVNAFPFLTDSCYNMQQNTRWKMA